MTFKLQTQVDDAFVLLNVSARTLLKNKIVKQGIRMPSKQDERGIAQTYEDQLFSESSESAAARPRRHADSSVVRIKG